METLNLRDRLALALATRPAGGTARRQVVRSGRPRQACPMTAPAVPGCAARPPPARLAAPAPLPYGLAGWIRRKRARGRPTGEPGVIRGENTLDRRLLEHDLADEYG